MPTELPSSKPCCRNAGACLHVTLNRPETKNAINREMVRDLTASPMLADDADIRAVVFRGANGTFCSGGDINGFKAMFDRRRRNPARRTGRDPQSPLRRIMSRFEALPQTIVMVVEGAAYGGGLGLMCGGDVVLATADAKFSISETTLGVPPAQIAPFVAARIGVARTRRLALTGIASTAARRNASGWSTRRSVRPRSTRRSCKCSPASGAARPAPTPSPSG